LRNLADIRLAFREIERVLRPGGRVAILDTDRPDGGLMGALHRLYLLRCIPTMAGIIHGSGDMYRYLASSALSFLSATELATHCATVGLEIVRVQKLMGGASVAVLAAKAR
jgi:demethylmenaquinone methyltransferase/2-methoxy-6-polyprenyl-1,4-benzoquinol methylase